MAVWLVNPKKRKRSRKKGTVKRKRSSSSMKRKMARVRSFIKKGGKKPMARRRRKRKASPRRRTRTRYIYKRKSYSRPKRRRATKRRYRRNPRMPRTVRGFGNQIFNGVIDAGEVVLGKALAKSIPNMIGIPSAGPMGLLMQAVVAVGVGFVGNQFISSNAGKMMLAGALASPVEDMIKQAGIPFISTALGENDVFIEGMNSYPQISSYPQQMGEDDYYAVGEEDEVSMYQ